MNNQDFKKQLQAALRDSEALDQATNDRLLQARINALDAAAKEPRSFSPKFFIPWGGAIAAAAVAAVLFTQPIFIQPIFIQPIQQNPTQRDLTIEQRALAASNDQMIAAILDDEELYEDMEFYLWLADSGYDS